MVRCYAAVEGSDSRSPRGERMIGNDTLAPEHIVLDDDDGGI